jgi:hypothetical protein
MDRFWELLERSVIIQSTLALVCVLVVCYLYVTGQEVPDSLVNVIMLILGFYFGSKATNEIHLAGTRRRE